MITPPHFGLKKQEKHNETDYKKEERDETRRCYEPSSKITRSKSKRERRVL